MTGGWSPAARDERSFGTVVALVELGQDCLWKWRRFLSREIDTVEQCLRVHCAYLSALRHGRGHRGTGMPTFAVSGVLVLTRPDHCVEISGLKSVMLRKR